MATKEESPTFQRKGSAEEEHASPKKRRKVNHGRYEARICEAELLLIDIHLDSMCILPAIGKQAFREASKSRESSFAPSLWQRRK
jgi:hypothetical protein